jgi:putative DNA primase/helicase
MTGGPQRRPLGRLRDGTLVYEHSDRVLVDALRSEQAQDEAEQAAAESNGRAQVVESTPPAHNGHAPRHMPNEHDDPGPAEPHPAGELNHSGQVRMAYRLAHAYRSRLLYVHSLGWHYWDGERWADDDRGEATRAVLDVLQTALATSLGDKELQRDVRKCESASGVAGVLEIAAKLTPFAATVRDLDADPYLLNVANGTLDLRTMELSPHEPTDRITKVTRAAYDPAAPSHAWSRFLARVLPHADVREYLQRTIGVALLGKVIEHVLPILTGTGANGKGTTYKALCWALGDYASTAEPDLFMHRPGAHPTGEMDLLGRRLVVVSESDKDRRLAEATMKRLTGGDTIRARRMRQDFIEFEPTHLPLLITNHLPKVSGDDPAVWRRLRVIPFDVEILDGERDTGLDEALQAEADAVLSWAIAGWVDYQVRQLDEPPAVVAATDDYQRASDAVGRFIEDECVTTSPALKATTGQLHEAWEQWRVRDGAEPMSQKAFGQALDRHGYPADKAVNGKRWRPGIGLKVATDED